MNETVLLKLGGSLITDKNRRQTARRDTIARLAAEIASALKARPALQLVVGHGAGSFGHIEAREYGTRAGVHSPAAWRRFAEVAAVAARLNGIMLEALRAADVPAMAFQPSASVIAEDAVVSTMAAEPMRRALQSGLVPIVHGDVAFDDVRGGTIISTEDIFRYLATELKPSRILLAGIEPGVIAGYPDGNVISEITTTGIDSIADQIQGSHAPDVTGGMESKVREMLAQIGRQPELEVQIFSGEEAGLVFAALTGQAQPGTRLRAA